MDPVLAYTSALRLRQTDVPPTRDAETNSFAQAMSYAEPSSPGAVGSAKGKDPAADQQRMLHLISHIDAECFISLLQILDPKPDDYRARAEYKRRYDQLRETLEVPLPPEDPQPGRSPTE